LSSVLAQRSWLVTIPANSTRSDIDQSEPLPTGRLLETFVDHYHLKGRWTAFRGHERRRKLQRVGAPNG
jgi:hypothetical protein